MDKKSKILLAALIVLTIVSIGYSFWKTIVVQDFEIREDIPMRE